MSVVRRQWCAMLAKLVAPMEPEIAARAFVDMLPLLPTDDTLYTRATLDAAACCDRRTAVPNFTDVSRVLGRAGLERLPVAVRMGYRPPQPLLVAPCETLAEREAAIARNQPALAALKAGAAAKRHARAKNVNNQEKRR